MRKLIIFLILINFNLQGQKDSIQTPFNKNSKNKNWAIKGKVLPFPIGNDLGINGLLGVEFAFLKNHTIGVDAYCLYLFGSHDKVKDTAGVEHEVGSFHKSFDKAIFMNYRFYFDFKKLRANKGLSLFTGCFYRYGQVNSSKDPAFEKEYINTWETDNSAGLFFGGIYHLRKRLGLDFNLGYYYKQMNIRSTYLDKQDIKIKTENPNTTGLRIGLNLTYWFSY